MHRAAAAAAVASLAPEQLRHHPVGARALGETVVMAAVRRHDRVTRPQLPAPADGDRLLSDRQMQRTRNHLRPELLVRRFLEAPDREHPLVLGEKLSFRVRDHMHLL